MSTEIKKTFRFISEKPSLKIVASSGDVIEFSPYYITQDEGVAAELRKLPNIYETDSLQGASVGVLSDKMVLRDSQGRAKVANPAEHDDIATKDYTDTGLAAKAEAVHKHNKNDIDGLEGLDNLVKSVNANLPDVYGNITIEKDDIGLGNVDNTPDMDKPVSTAAAAVISEAKQACNTYTDTKTAETMSACKAYTNGELLETEALCKTYTDDKTIGVISACKTYTNEKTAEAKTEATTKITQVETDLAGLGESMVMYVTGIHDILPACIRVEKSLALNASVVGILFQQPLHALDTADTVYLYRRFVGTLHAYDFGLFAEDLPIINIPSASPFTTSESKHAFISCNPLPSARTTITTNLYNRDLHGWERIVILSQDSDTNITLEILSSAPKPQEPAPEENN